MAVPVDFGLWNTSFSLPIPYDELSDGRTKYWLLVNTWTNVAAWVAFYLIMVWHLPKIMDRRNPYTLRPLLIIYNLALALLNAYICKELLMSALKLNYNFFCQACREVYSKHELQMAAAVWWYYFSKLLEFSDTLFFILRKKSKQLSFLHFYHHSTMFPLWWIAVKYLPTGSTFFYAMINSFVHVIMYGYYGLSALGPRVQKYLWWKKHLTAIQLIQFVVSLVWAVQALMRGCDYPRWISSLIVAYMITFLILFGRFYVNNYIKKGKKKMKEKTEFNQKNGQQFL